MKIKILPNADARLIAAGEVIERPASALRELLDNAIDANSSNIAVYLEEGGIKALIVKDDGMGMDKEDLPLAILPHATSKISTINDLQTSYTLGFRGEALSSLASCSYLEIVSKTENNNAYSMKVSDGVVNSIEPCAFDNGSSVIVRELFYNFPARRRFLKGSTAEEKECVKIFIEKATSHPDISFKLYSAGKLKYNFEKCDQLMRVNQIYGDKMSEKPILLENILNLDDDGQELTIIAGNSNVYRADKRYIHLYVNRRKIDEFALVQAVLYAYNSVMPKGQFPYCFMFFKVRADLADFNIHPTKHEAKFHILSLMHKQVVNMLSPFISGEMKKQFKPIEEPSISQQNLENLEVASAYPNIPSTGRFLNVADLPITINEENLLDNRETFVEKTNQIEIKNEVKRDIPNPNDLSQSDAWHYYGQLMGVFLMVEWGQTFYLIDQHAAHERILFNQYKKQKMVSQRLLIPITIEVTEMERSAIMLSDNELSEFGVEIKAKSKHTIEIIACPNLMDEAFWVEYVKGLTGDIAKNVYATLSCRNAIKEGEYIDDNSAWKLVQATFSLAEPYCPHGRPVWVEISRTQLYRWVKRLV